MWVFMCGLAAATPAQAVARETRFSDTEGVLGTTLRVGIDATSASASEASEAAVRKEIARLDAVLSGWTPDREFSKLQAAGRGVGVSPDLFAVLDAAERFHRIVHFVLTFWSSFRYVSSTKTSKFMAIHSIES
jgi:thiamine biosynthesis lipoprotein ApbE